VKRRLTIFSFLSSIFIDHLIYYLDIDGAIHVLCLCSKLSRASLFTNLPYRNGFERILVLALLYDTNENRCEKYGNNTRFIFRKIANLQLSCTTHFLRRQSKPGSSSKCLLATMMPWTFVHLKCPSDSEGSPIPQVISRNGIDNNIEEISCYMDKVQNYRRMLHVVL